MPWPLAYFLTWTTYGTRLYGDRRGSVDRAHNQRGTPVLATDAARESRVREYMSASERILNGAGRGIVEVAIADHG